MTTKYDALEDIPKEGLPKPHAENERQGDVLKGDDNMTKEDLKCCGNCEHLWVSYSEGLECELIVRHNDIVLLTYKCDKWEINDELLERAE